MKKTETLYSYLYKKSNKMWAVKYKFHKKDAYKNTSLGTRNKREAESLAEAQFFNADPSAELLATIEIMRESDTEGNKVDMATGGEIRPAQLLKLLMMAPMDPDQVDEYVHITKARDESKEGIVYKDLVILNKEETKDLLNLNDRT